MAPLPVPVHPPIAPIPVPPPPLPPPGAEARPTTRSPTTTAPRGSVTSNRCRSSSSGAVPTPWPCGPAFVASASAKWSATTASEPSWSGSRPMARSIVSSARRRTTTLHAPARRSRSNTPSSPRARRSFSRRVSTLHSTRCAVPRPGLRWPSAATRIPMKT
ncbi:hypothetical protein BDA96_10G011300 [Sorghum bicolor]|uniref:Uncharacterized protein n=1 Tax=Sorghum bicolor TaxID=4558 RepID=A0A921PXF7_SORBI|nr:hypothetical protein BDA96_10G011300 [Sorghum bicolor]